MKKELKRIGNSIGIIFDKEDCRIYGLELGDIVDISEIIVTKKPLKKK